GFRIELGEIENRLLEHGSVREAIVLDRKEPGGEIYLCAYILPVEQAKIDELTIQLREHLAERLPEYMIPAYFMPIDGIPLTPSGKVDRRAFPHPRTGGKARAYTPPGNETETKLAAIWARVLALEENEIGIEANFFEVGGHSLKATLLVSKIHKELDVKLTLQQIFKTPTIRSQARIVQEARKEDFYSIERAAAKEYYPLSSAQKRIYILQRMEEEGTGYNMPTAARLQGKPDKTKLADALRKLVERHDSLRTSFHMINGEPVQKVHRHVEISIEETPGSNSTGTTHTNAHHLPYTAMQTFIRPFHLSQPPLLRVGLENKTQNTQLLMVDMHHIIADGISQEILLKDFIALYENNPLPDLRLQYTDYAEWQNREKEKETLQNQKTYWLKEFEAEIPVLKLPLDYTRPAVQRFEGKTLEFEIGTAETGQLKKLALNQNVTLYMLLLTLFNTLLSKLSGQENIVVGTPSAGRRHADLEGIIGMFVNTLALKNCTAGNQPFDRILQDVKERTLKAFENQDYQF
ncbi:MAG: non-ribosomal peptide synthetase, partial [bacterium]|nr:non-ribosomal peptide synthetase [bacterium]